MKTTTRIIRKLILTTAALAGVAHVQAANRTLILLQQNSTDRSYMTANIADPVTRSAADEVIARSLATIETKAFETRASLFYQRFVNLSDQNCTRANLLNQLILQTKQGYTTDLVILGSGSNEVLKMNSGENLTGQTVLWTETTIPISLDGTSDGKSLTIVNSSSTESTTTTVTDPGTIRGLLKEARALEGTSFNFKLRLVYMGNSHGGTTNDDWLSIGARAAVGCPFENFMPEPMIQAFWNGFLTQNKNVRQSSIDSLAAAKAAYHPIPGYHVPRHPFTITMFDETRQEVSGNGNLIFRDECQMALNETRIVSVKANKTLEFSGIYLEAGHTYKFTVDPRSLWKNRTLSVNADGHAPSNNTEAFQRRYPVNIMTLMAERHSQPYGTASLIGGSGFTIGTARTVTANGNGFLNFFANDALSGYADNFGIIPVQVTRVSGITLAPTPSLTFN